MAVASIIDLDLGKAAPILALGAIGFGLWYIWNKQEQQAATNAAAAQASPLAAYQDAADLALLQSFTGGGTASATTTNAQGSVTTNPTAGIIQNGTVTANTDLAQYSSAPDVPTAPATASQSIANSTATTTSNGI